jgi:hypothetical protein
VGNEGLRQADINTSDGAASRPGRDRSGAPAGAVDHRQRGCGQRFHAHAANADSELACIVRSSPLAGRSLKRRYGNLRALHPRNQTSGPWSTRSPRRREGRTPAARARPLSRFSASSASSGLPSGRFCPSSRSTAPCSPARGGRRTARCSRAASCTATRRPVRTFNTGTTSTIGPTRQTATTSFQAPTISPTLNRSSIDFRQAPGSSAMSIRPTPPRR